MNDFKNFNIKPTPTKCFVGTKIKMSKILNKQIIVHDFKVEESKIFKDKGKPECLHLQIEVDNLKHVVFTSALGMIDAIKKVPKESFPFTTIIVEENERFIFS